MCMIFFKFKYGENSRKFYEKCCSRRERKMYFFLHFFKNQKLFTIPDLFKFAPKSKILIKSVMVKGGGKIRLAPPPSCATAEEKLVY